MATYKQVSYGSQGSDVTELQKLLNKNGYSLKEDGIFGSQTQQAVRDYQQKNKLAVDGIVGNNTWGALTKVSAPSPTTGTSGSASNQAPTTSAKAPTFDNKAYQPSDAVTQAQALLNQQLSQKPGAYQSPWQTQLNDTINKILNREKFSYDLNADAFYQQYKDKFVQQGKMAMMDTIGQAQAMTGGYGNSYAQSVGQQAYQAQLQNLNDIVPELYQMALDQYNQEGQDLYNQYAMLGAQEDQDYGRYRDQMSDYNAELDRLYNQYNAERDYDYSKYSDERDFAYGKYADDRAYAYQEERDNIADQRWQAEFDEAKRQYDQQYALSAQKASSSGSAGSTGSTGGNTSNGNNYTSSGTTYDTGGLSKAKIQEMQAWYGTSADGIWGNQSTKAAGGRSVTDAWEYYQANKDGQGKKLSPYQQLREDLDAIIAGEDSYGNKVAKGEISSVIREALRNGEITQNQAQNLLSIYAPRGYTY